MKEYNLYDYDFLVNETDRKPGDYWTLSHAEVEAFGINPDLVEKLEKAKYRYEIMAGIIQASESNRLEATRDRLRYSKFVRKSKGKDGITVADDALCAAFMSLVCELPFDQCFVYMRRWEILLCRTGNQILPERPKWP